MHYFFVHFNVTHSVLCLSIISGCMKYLSFNFANLSSVHNGVSEHPKHFNNFVWLHFPGCVSSFFLLLDIVFLPWAFELLTELSIIVCTPLSAKWLEPLSAMMVCKFSTSLKRVCIFDDSVLLYWRQEKCKFLQEPQRGLLKKVQKPLNIWTHEWQMRSSE